MITLFIWLMIKAIFFACRLTWGFVKLSAGILIVLALPLLIVCLALSGSIILLLPLAMIAMAVGMMKSCISI